MTLLLDLQLITVQVRRKKSRSEPFFAPGEQEICSVRNQGGCTSALSRYPTPPTDPINQLPPIAANSSSTFHDMAQLDHGAHAESKLSGEASWKSQFKIVFHMPNGSIKIRIAVLDTGATVDVMTKKVADSLGVEMEPYYGEDLIPLKGALAPLGQVTLDWHVINRIVTYTTTFLVVDCEGFDVLLGESTIKNNKFYTVNSKVFLVKRGYI